MIFANSQILETTNYVTYKLQNFVSDIGGLVGLFLGLSLLSVFEFILSVFHMLKKYLKKPTPIPISEKILTVVPFRKN